MSSVAKQGQGGAVLIFVLLLVAVLAALAVQTIRTAQVEILGIKTALAAVKAKAMAEAGLLAAVAILGEDARNTSSDNLTEAWAVFPQQSPFVGSWFIAGKLDGRIVDETGKFPINSLHPALPDHERFEPIFVRLLTGKPFLVTPARAKALLAALQDWLDKDDQPRESGGAEESFYMASSLPYRCKNASVDTLRELLLVRGFTPELLDGHDNVPGLVTVLTVWTSGLINVNTAPLPVLAALANTEDATKAWDLAQRLDTYRRDPVNRSTLGSLAWLDNDATGGKGTQWPTGILTVKSLYFSVLLRGRSGASVKRLYAVLERNLPSAAGRQDTPLEVLYKELR